MENSQAVPFIIYKENLGFYLNPDAEQYLKSLPPENKLGVISIVGKYRTGKSFFVNRVILNKAGQNQGFSVGPTINPCTKGLWLWKETIQSENPEHQNMDVILIDTEGFGGMDENINHDSRIFLFSLLLSSYFIYNSVGNIDESALTNLSLIINLAKEIQFKQNNNGNGSAGSAQGSNNTAELENPGQYFPSFLWVVRDFVLQMIDSQGNKITQKDYLERALELQKGVSDSIESKNRIRRLFKHFFQERDCSTLVRPVESEKDLQRLNEMKNQELRQEFVEQITQLRKKIFKKIRPKVLNGRPLNGILFVEICKAYIEAMNKGNLPNVENAWNYVCRSECEKALQFAINEGELRLASLQGPLQKQDLLEVKDQIKDYIREVFRKKAIAPEEELTQYYALLEKGFMQKFKDFKAINKEQWNKRFDTLCNEAVKKIEDKLRNEEYQNFFEFQADVQSFKDSFESEAKNKQKDYYFIQMSQKLYKLAAEKLSKRLERDFDKESRRWEQRVSMSENDLTNKKREWEEERNTLQKRISELERECAIQANQTQTFQQKLTQSKQEREKLQGQLDEIKNQFKEQQNEVVSRQAQKIQQLESKMDERQHITTKVQTDLEKKLALLEQELNFSQKEVNRLQNRLSEEDSEQKKVRNEMQSQITTIEMLKRQLNDTESRKNEQIQVQKIEFDRKVSDLNSEKERMKDFEKQQNEWLVEKSYLENQTTFLKNQLDENKRLHDALLSALQQGLNKDDNESTNELVETNRHLSAAMDKMEIRCKLAEEKSEKLKSYKRVVKNSTAHQCTHCSKFICSAIFLQHLTSCIPQQQQQASSNLQQQQSPIQSIQQLAQTTQQKTQQQYQQIAPFTANQQQQNQVNPLQASGYLNQSLNSNSSLLMNNNTNNQQNFLNLVPPIFLNLDCNSLQVSINQTMVRESEDNKPYTEYMIQVIYSNYKWQIARKYKHFCELHQVISTTFPQVELPESSAAIINSNTEINQKRPTVIEERRKALQQYIRDLIKIDLIRNSKAFKNFLEIEKHISESRPMMLQQQQQQINSYRGLDKKAQHSFCGSLTSARSLISEKDNVHLRENSASMINTSSQLLSEETLQQQLTQQSGTHQQQQQSLEQTKKIDKNMLPQSPKSFLKAWHHKNKENKNPQARSKSLIESENSIKLQFHTSQFSQLNGNQQSFVNAINNSQNNGSLLGCNNNNSGVASCNIINNKQISNDSYGTNEEVEPDQILSIVKHENIMNMLNNRIKSNFDEEKKQNEEISKKTTASNGGVQQHNQGTGGTNITSDSKQTLSQKPNLSIGRQLSAITSTPNNNLNYTSHQQTNIASTGKEETAQSSTVNKYLNLRMKKNQDEQSSQSQINSTAIIQAVVKNLKNNNNNSSCNSNNNNTNSKIPSSGQANIANYSAKSFFKNFESASRNHNKDRDSLTDKNQK